MTKLPPALLELLSKVLVGEATSDELLSQIEASTEIERSGIQGAGIQDGGDLRAAGELEACGGTGLDAASSATRETDGATVDLGRQARCGFGEVIYGEGKSTELITQIIRAQLAARQPALVTRIDAGVAFQVRQSFHNTHHNPLAKTLRVSTESVGPSERLSLGDAERTRHAAVVTAGSTDRPVAEEAIETLAWMGVAVQRFDDIGVAGPQRLAAVVPQLRLASSVVVIAGMEGALPAVVAGHLAVPVFAVPTSVGYGANLAGLTPLMGMLSSCAANVAVVNIDGGFKGGYLAGLIVRQLEQAGRREQAKATSDARSNRQELVKGTSP